MKELCAIYVRVSSDLQDYERQLVDMKVFAEQNNLSYSKNFIYEDKLSGYRDETEREGLNKLLVDVIKHGIKKVLIWEISRLARKHLDLLKYTEFFKTNCINVYFLTQRLWLLNESHNIDALAGLSIAFFGWHGEYETRLTKERFLSAKKLNESLGKYNGGNITFGYSINEDNKYIINNQKLDGLDVSPAEIVKEIFTLYENGLTCSKICRINQAKQYPKHVCSTQKLSRLLRDTSYLGYKNTKLGKRPMPQLIEPSQFSIVASLIDANKTKADKGRKHVFLLRGVLKCTYCGGYYFGKQTDDAYICSRNSGFNRTNKDTSCPGGNISTSTLDGIIWALIRNILTYKKVKGFDFLTKNGTNEIIDIKNQVNQFTELIKKTEIRKKKANIMFNNDGISSTEYQKLVKEINNEKKTCEKEITILESKIRHHEKIQKESYKLSQRVVNIKLISDRHQMQTIINNLIESINIYKIDRYKTVVFVKYHHDYSETLFYNSVQKKGNYFRRFNNHYIRYDESTKKFYKLKNEFWEIKARTEILKNHGIDNLPEFIELKEFKRIVNVNNIEGIIESQYLDPYPTEVNSDILDFNTINLMDEIPYKLSRPLPFEKITYFKELNNARFSRKKKTNPKL